MKRQSWMLKRHAWTFCAELASAAITVIALILFKPFWALGGAILTVVLAALTRKWARQDPIPMPHALHWLMFLPRPFQSPARLQSQLALHGGEHLLEVGPGTGRYSLPIAASLGSSGVLQVLDVQQEMLDHLMRRASRAGIANFMATTGDAARLPYPDGRFDGAYLMATLGEIPDKDAALQELHRVLKPTGCLVVGEIGFDPDFIPLAELQSHLHKAGFTFERKTGPWWSYLARFKKGETSR